MTFPTREQLIEKMAKASKEATIECYTSIAEPFNPDFPDIVHNKIAEANLNALIAELPYPTSYAVVAPDGSAQAVHNADQLYIKLKEMGK